LSRILVNSATAKRLLEQSTDQWSTFLKLSHKWLGNVLFDGLFFPDYSRCNAISAQELVRSIYNVQQERSFYLNVV